VADDEGELDLNPNPKIGRDWMVHRRRPGRLDRARMTADTLDAAQAPTFML